MNNEDDYTSLDDEKPTKEFFNQMKKNETEKIQPKNPKMKARN